MWFVGSRIFQLVQVPGEHGSEAQSCRLRSWFCHQLADWLRVGPVYLCVSGALSVLEEVTLDGVFRDLSGSDGPEL